jgi:hypothetical protein
MKEFIVTVRRTEHIMFSVEAEDEDDARERYLYDGDETGASTREHEVLRIDEEGEV